MAGLPHDGVWTRLGVSAIHGIGVFAIRPIPAGTNPFASDDAPLCWIDAAQAGEADAAARALYWDFGIQRDGRIGCPADFNRLTVGWYLNEPLAGDAPNVVAQPDGTLAATRDIAQGEELTVDYAIFSDRSAAGALGHD